MLKFCVVLFSWLEQCLPVALRPRRILDMRQRAGEWRRVRAEHLKKYPVCEVCGRDKNLIVHHIFPVSVAPELALVENNLLTMCETPCHFMFGHFFSYHCYNREVRSMAKKFRAQLLKRKCQPFK
jgi:hypothetical protein